MYKAVFLDLDGTLLDDNKNISEENKETIKYIRQKGVEVVLCSGRQKSMVVDYQQEIGASNYVICCNGSQIVDTNINQEIFCTTLEDDLIYNLYNFACNNDYLIRIDTPHGRFINNMNYFISKEIELKEDISTFIKQNKVLQITLGAEKENSIDEAIKYINSLNRHDIKIENKYNAISKTFNIWAINIINRNASKGNAISGLCKYLKIDLKDVIAMGDDYNDISMMQMVGHGVAMGNAVEEVKKYAKEVTKTNNDNGVANILKNYF